MRNLLTRVPRSAQAMVATQKPFDLLQCSGEIHVDVLRSHR